ncbi:YdcF family protein [Amycolatopsis sp. 195334CR]|uniref:YdcF family protein n=1 Tax=Amycolatopsis sp. 195334CR TaxID=2814588 RepID=UPI0027DE5F66|nr:YdcF family protein [Amycolatopsis sp. 195334CR]
MLYGSLAAVAFTVFAAGFLREPRRVSNAVWLGVAATLSGLALLVFSPAWVRETLLLPAIAAVALLTPVALLGNGVVMWRREGHRPANVLSLAAGVALAGVVVLTLVLGPAGSRWAMAALGSVLLACAYVSFLFACLLVYSVLYGRIVRRRGVTAILVLGAGLRGAEVPPLLAGRLDRARQLYRRQSGEPPLIVVSGGQGPGETVTEAVAMRDYLVRRGIPAAKVLLEEQATSTEENLRYGVEVLGKRSRAEKTVVVTNNYHVFRTAVTARRMHLPVHVLGSPTALYFLPSAFIREFVALLVHYWRINLILLVLLVILPWLAAVFRA